MFSNAALHWMNPPEPVAESIAAALKPGGRLVAEFGGKGNIRSITDAIGKHPWYYPSIAEYATLLERYRIQVVTAALFPRPTAVEGESGLRDWLKMFTSEFVRRRAHPCVGANAPPKTLPRWYLVYRLREAPRYGRQGFRRLF